MKAIAIILTVTACLMAPIAAQNAHAQLELTLGAGLNSPTGEYGDQMKVGYAVITGVGYRLMPYLAVGAEFDLYGNSGSDEVLAGFAPGTELTSTIQQYAGVAKLLVPVGNHHVFAKGLVGSYHGKAKASGPTGSGEASNSNVGYGLGTGFLIQGERSSSFFLEVMYHHIPFEGGSADVNFFSFNAGAVFAISLSD